eukprot:jgi/Galph1/2308/GphlegSOOS_G1026.1
MIHHEPQRWRYCAVHAVNALIGYAAYTEEDFEQVALQLEEEIGSVGQSHRQVTKLYGISCKLTK